MLRSASLRATAVAHMDRPEQRCRVWLIEKAVLVYELSARVRALLRRTMRRPGGIRPSAELPWRRMSIWAPVVAALGTGIIGFGGLVWQQLHRDRKAASAEKGEAYHQMIAHSLSFTIRAQALRNTMRTRSGFNERLDLALRLRRPLDPMDLHDWLAEGFEPINQAWSKIEIVGSAEAIGVATELVDACADVVGLATQFGEARGRFRTYIRGFEWTAEQQKALDSAVKRVMKHRRAFVRLARKELGKTPVPLRLDAATEQRKVAETAAEGAAKPIPRGDG
jgi:hypothetical protein